VALFADDTVTCHTEINYGSSCGGICMRADVRGGVGAQLSTKASTLLIWVDAGLGFIFDRGAVDFGFGDRKCGVGFQLLHKNNGRSNKYIYFLVYITNYQTILVLIKTMQLVQ